MTGTASSATSVNSGGRAISKPLSPRAGGGNAVWQRKVTSSAPRKAAGGSASMWRFYTEDSPGIKIGPVPVLVMSLLFIASVFMLHIWGKYSRG